MLSAVSLFLDLAHFSLRIPLILFNRAKLSITLVVCVISRPIDLAKV